MTTVSDLIESAAAAAAVSASVKIQPSDSRCRYWAKVLRAGCALPLPSDVKSASDIPGAYLRKGDEELFFGDVLIEGEENHHRKARGWTYNVSTVGMDGKQKFLPADSAAKAAMKSAGLPAALLAGSGEIAACVRVAHAVRLGIAGL